MPFQSTGAASPDLSTFTGTNTGFTGGGGFQFGKLLEERWRMQKKMLEMQLKAMKEQLKQSKYAAGAAQSADQAKNLKGRRDLRDPNRRDEWVTVQEGGAGVAGPGWTYRPLVQHALNRETGETRGMFMPESGGFAPDTSTQGAPNAMYQDALRMSNIAARMAPQKYSATGNVTGDIPGATLQLPGFDLGSLQTRVPETDRIYGMQDLPAQNTPQPGDADFIGPLPAMKKGGYVPKTGPYKLHKGEIVLNPEQSKAMFPGVGPGPQKRGYQEGSWPGMTPEGLLIYQRLIQEARQKSGQLGLPGSGNPLLPVPQGPGGPGINPNIPPPLAGAPGGQGLLGPGPESGMIPYDRPVGPGGRSLGPGRTFYGTGPETYPLVPGTAERGAETLSVGRGATAGVGRAGLPAGKVVTEEGLEAAVKVAAKVPKVGKLGALGMGAAAGVAGMALADGDESSSKTWEAVKQWIRMTPVGIALKYSPASLALKHGFDIDVAEVLVGAAKEVAKTHPVGVLMSEALGEKKPQTEPSATAEIEPFKPPYRIEEEDGRKKLIGRGQPESKAEKFQRYVDELQEKVEKSEHDEQMARARAYDLETQINKRPYADNKQLKKMMMARTQEADRHKKTQEAARSEFSAIKVQQQQMESELAKAYQLNKTKQLDTAFDAIDQYWKTSVKLDDGDDKFVEYSIGMLLPYMNQLQRLGGYNSPEETKEALRQTLSNSYDRPEEYQWLKLMLQQGG